MIGRDRDDHRLAAHVRRKLGGEEVADLAAALADQADDDHVGVGAGHHLAHQHRFADAGAGDDRDPLADAGGEQER